MKKVLVTGAGGYIGSHVCLSLKQAGYIVHGWDNYHHKSQKYNDVTSICDKHWNIDITSNFDECQYDVVVHLAGLSLITKSIQIPTEYYRVNTFGTANVLNKITTDHFIFASTSAAWEMASPYARSKVAAEDIIKEKSKGYTIFRFFNVSGNNGQFRQFKLCEHLIKVAAEVAVGKKPYIEIYGEDYPTRDGTCIRDYVHVCDVADSIVEAVEQGPTNTPYECLGTNKGFTVKEVIKVMREVTGEEIPEIVCPRRLGDAVICVVDKLSKLMSTKKTIYDMCRDQYLLELKG